MINAAYDSRCPGCDEQIYEGDRIGKIDGEWCCENCVDEAGGEDEREPR